PIIIVTRWQREKLTYEARDYCNITLEIWNRRKYPITIREVFLELKQVKILSVDGDRWQQSDSTIWMDEVHKSIAPTTFEPITVDFVVEPSGVDMPSVFAVHYFDPRLNKRMEVESKSTLL